MKKLIFLLVIILASFNSFAQVVPYNEKHSVSDFKNFLKENSVKSKICKALFLQRAKVLLKDTLVITDSTAAWLYQFIYREEITLPRNGYENTDWDDNIQNLVPCAAHEYPGFCFVLRIGSYEEVIAKGNCFNFIVFQLAKAKAPEQVVQEQQQENNSPMEELSAIMPAEVASSEPVQMQPQAQIPIPRGDVYAYNPPAYQQGGNVYAYNEPNYFPVYQECFNSGYNYGPQFEQYAYQQPNSSTHGYDSNPYEQEQGRGDPMSWNRGGNDPMSWNRGNGKPTSWNGNGNNPTGWERNNNKPISGNGNGYKPNSWNGGGGRPNGGGSGNGGGRPIGGGPMSGHR